MWDSMGAGGVCFFYAKLLFNVWENGFPDAVL